MGEILLNNRVENYVDEFDIGLICSSFNQILVGNPLHRFSYYEKLDNYGKPMRYREDVNAVKLNCANKFVAFASNSLAIFDLEREISIRQLHDHDGVVTDVAWHHSSPYQLASVSRTDGTLRIWDVRSHPAQVSVRRVQRPFSHVEYSPDCSFIACSGEGITIFDLNSAQSIVNISCSSYVTNIVFNPTECLLASSSEDRIVRFWDVDTGECVTQSLPFDSIVHSTIFHPKGKYLICASAQHFSAIVWEPFDTIAQVPKMILPSTTTVCESKLWLTLDLCIQDDRLLQLTVPSNNLLKCCGHNSTSSLLNENILTNEETCSTNVVRLTTLPLEELEQCIPRSANAVMGCGLSQLPSYYSLKNSCIKSNDEFFFSNSAGNDHQPLSIVPQLVSPLPLSKQFSYVKHQQTSNSSSDTINFEPSTSDHIRSSPVITEDPFVPTHELPRESVPPVPSNELDSHRGSIISEIGAKEEDSSLSGEGRTSVASFSSSNETNGDDTLSNRTVNSRRFAQQSSQIPMSNLIVSRSPSTIPTLPAHNNTNSADGIQSKMITGRQRRPSSPFCTASPQQESVRSTTSPMKTSQTFAQNPTMPAINHANAKSSLKQLRSKSCNTNAKNSSRDSINDSPTSTALQKSPAKLLSRRLSSTSTKTDHQENISDASKIDDLIRGSRKVHTLARRKATELEIFLAQANVHSSSNFSEEIVDYAAKQDDLRMFARLLKTYLEHPKTYSLGLNIKFLEKARALFAHQNPTYVILALDLLEMIVHAFGDSIRHGLAAKCYALGVDVAAEQRFEKCSRCRSILLELRLNASFLVERLDDAHKPTFNNILLQIDRITVE